MTKSRSSGIGALHGFAPWPFLGRVAGLALLYAAIASVVLILFPSSGIVSLVWPPSGLALAALLLGGRKYWPGIFFGAFAIGLWAGSSPLVALAIAGGNTLEALVGHWLLTQRGDFDIRFDRPRHFMRLFLVAAACALPGVLLGSTALLLSGFFTAQTILPGMVHWWQSELLGMLLVTPAILLWRQPPWTEWFTRRHRVALPLFLLLAFIGGQIVFLDWFHALFRPVVHAFWSFLFVSIAAERFGRHGAALALGMTAVQALAGAALGHGFFATDIADTGLEGFWFFMFLLTLTGFFTALLLSEYRLVESALRREKTLSDDIIDGLPGAFYMLDDQGRLVRWNRRLLADSGYSADEIRDRVALDLIVEEDRAIIGEAILRVFAEGAAAAEGRVLTRDGRARPYQFNSRRTIIDGKVYLVGLGEDITERKRIEQALRESESKYRLLFENTDARIVIFDTDGIVLMINESNARMMGGTPADFIGRSMYDLVPDGTAELYRQRFEQIFSEQRGGIFEDSYTLPDGLHWFSSQLEPVRDGGGNIYGIQLVAVDITRRKRVEDALRQSEELWKFALEGAGDSVWELDAQSGQMKYSARWQQMLGYDADEVVDDIGDWGSRMHPDDFPAVVDTQSAFLAGKIETSSNEARMRCKDGRWKWILARGMVVSRDESGNPVRIVGTCTDISLLKEHQQQLEHVAHYDALTNLPNRLLLGFRLQQSMAQCQRRNQSLAVAYLDLDGFKAVNDRHGHGVGDELLVLVAQRMKTALRECDTLARIGGDEFIAVLADLDRLQDCEPVLERLLHAAAAPAKVGETDLQVSASIGVTIYPKDGVDADQLMRHADQAMYQAKQSGRNRYHLFDVERDAAVQIQRESIEHIRTALGRDEFVLHYQPKVNMKSGTLVGAEALIRWQHPERGLLPPAVFLPVIEDQQISIALGEWVIDTVLTQMEAWLDTGLVVPVSVNISAYHLQQGNFVERLAELLAAHPRVNPAHLELEILETSALADVMQVSETMRACRASGVTFALDDFGTGYSSLTYLRRLPVELLKIDQSFVRGMLDDPDDLAIVEGVIGLAMAFRRKAIAEGVETVAHGELLLQLGCELAQGYGISRPIPAEELPAWAENWRPDPSWAAWRYLD